MNQHKFIVSNKMEEFISTQRVNKSQFYMTSQQTSELKVIEAYPDVGILFDQFVHWFEALWWCVN